MTVAASTWSKRGVARALAIAALALGAGGAAGFAIGHGSAPESPGVAPAAPAQPSASASPPSAGPAELAVVAPLREGSTLEGFEVTAIHGVTEGMLRIFCKRDEGAVRLEIALASDAGPPPPARSGRYAIYYSVDRVPSEDGVRLALALAKLLDANAGVAPPPGLGPFVQKFDPTGP